MRTSGGMVEAALPPASSQGAVWLHGGLSLRVGAFETEEAVTSDDQRPLKNVLEVSERPRNRRSQGGAKA